MALFNRTTISFGRGIVPRLATVLLLCWAAAPDAQAQATNCSDFPNATLDGFVSPNPPSNINIDVNCTVKNFPQSNPLTTNFSFYTQPGQTDERKLIIFDNVYHTGQMSCNAVLEHKIWFVNGSSSTIQQGCQNQLIPVEKIDKQNPPGDVATVGVPFTYRLTIPVLFDPATGEYRIPRIIYSDAYFSETVAYADLVLPSTMQHEQLELNDAYNHRYLHWNEAAVDAPGERSANCPDGDDWRSIVKSSGSSVSSRMVSSVSPLA